MRPTASGSGVSVRNSDTGSQFNRASSPLAGGDKNRTGPHLSVHHYSPWRLSPTPDCACQHLEVCSSRRSRVSQPTNDCFRLAEVSSEQLQRIHTFRPLFRWPRQLTRRLRPAASGRNVRILPVRDPRGEGQQSHIPVWGHACRVPVTRAPMHSSRTQCGSASACAAF